MGRKSQRVQRRGELILAFAEVLADVGYSGATTLAVAERAGMSPGLIHHHFKNKDEMLDELLTYLVLRFRVRLMESESEDLLENYVNGALRLDGKADGVAAKCWVGLLAEALKNQKLFNRVKRHLDEEISRVRDLSDQKLGVPEASSVLAYIFGSLVFGAFAPRKTAGFAADGGHRLVAALRS